MAIKLSELKAQQNNAPVENVLSEAGSNLLPSAVQYGSDMWQAISNPIDTADSLAQLGLGIIQAAIPEAYREPKYKENLEMAKAVAQHFVDRYGSIEATKRTFAKDPVGFLGDASMLITGGAGIAKQAAKAGNVTKTTSSVIDKVGDVGRNIDPLYGSVSGLNKVGAFSVLPSMVGGIGMDATKTSVSSGQKGGEGQIAYLANLFNKNRGTDLVDTALNKVNTLADKRRVEYLNSMDGIKAAGTKLDFNPVIKAIDDIDQSFNFQRQPLLDKIGQAKLNEIKETVNIWKQNKAFHTVEGLDALKKKIDNLMPEGDVFGKTAGKTAAVVTKARTAVNNLIKKASPEYSKTMKAYEDAMKLETGIRKELSLGKTGSADTALRKLQSIMRDNVSTNFGERLNKVKLLDEAGDKSYLMESLAGREMSTLIPRGLAGRIIAPMALGIYNEVSTPMLAGLAGLSSPKTAGILGNLTGTVSRFGNPTRQAGVLSQGTGLENRPMY
tara:strand:+ start:1128 stop:2621 length:1494 start_codon:yes stop_codon:yes gene_type:complete